MTLRRNDLYQEKDISSPLSWELGNLAAVKLYYTSGVSGGVSLPKYRPSIPSVSEEYPLYRTTKKRDIDLISILEVCLETNNIPFKWKAQLRGTCVGQAASMAADMVMAVAWLISSKKFESRTAVATCYTGSRVEVARRSGNWDGSRGEWAAKYLTDWGIATLSELGLQETELQEDERLAVRWTAQRMGIPEKFELISKQRPIVKAPLVTTAEELIACLEAGNPVIDCSNVIPVDRNTDDVVPVRMGGGHATVFGAIRWRKNGDPEIKYVNSWTQNWGKNGCVWISIKDAVNILDQNDSFALIGVQGLSPEIPLL